MSTLSTARTQSGALVSAIRELEAVGAALVTQLDATRIALSSLRAVAGGFVASSTPPARPGRAKRSVARPRQKPSSAPHREITEATIREALADGPKSPKDLERHFGVTRYVLVQQLAPLIRRGVIVTSGHTTSRRIALAGAPAKERL